MQIPLRQSTVFMWVINKRKSNGEVMATRRRTKSTSAAPLIIEDHPLDYDGYPFITLIQQHTSHVLAIVDDVDDKRLRAFVLDLCGPAGVDEEQIIEVAAEWYEQSSTQYPLSIEFSKRNIAGPMSALLRSFNVDFITRVIGPMPRFTMDANTTVRRRRRKSVPPGLKVKRRQILQLSDTIGFGLTEKAS